jgi:hypothetical protein
MEEEIINLRKETVAGFVDRGGNFLVSNEKQAFLADRWVSDYFNINPNNSHDTRVQEVQESDQEYCNDQ